MPSLIGSLYVSLTADFSSFQRNMRGAESVVASTTSRIRHNMGATEKSVGHLHRTMNSGIRPGALIAAGRSFDSLQSRTNLLRGSVFALTAAFGGLGAALTTNVISRYLDTFTSLENQIRVVSTGAADLASQISAVAGVAERSRSSLAAVATLYSRLNKAAPQEGVVATLQRVETINKALQLGGATAQEAASAAIQFSQAIASNRLGGEELRAVLETPLGLELAKGIGVTIGKLREMGYEGKLTADVLFKALDRVKVSVDQKFAASVSTIDQALTVADGKITVFAGKLDDTYGITKLLSGSILAFANNLETLVPLLGYVGAGLGSAFAGRGLGGIVGRRVSIVQDIIAGRKESLKLAQEEEKVARRTADEARAAARAASSISADRAREFADPAAIKRYQRDLAALQKEDKRYLALLEERRVNQYQLGNVTTQTTMGALRASEALAREQIRLNDLTQQSVLLKNTERQAQTRLTAVLGQQTQNSTRLKAVRDAERDLQRTQTERLKLTQAIANQEQAITSRQIAVTNLRTEAERRAAQQRAALLVQEARLVGELDRSRTRRGIYTTSLRASSDAVRTTGLRSISQEQLDTATNMIRSEQAAIKAGTALSEATRAAGRFAIAGAVVGRAWSGVLGLFGGGAGLAFTGIILGLTLLGVRAARTAEEIARARQIISEELGRLNEAGNNVGANERAAILSDQILAETDRMRLLADRLEGLQSDFLGAVGQRIYRDFSGSDKQLNEFQTRFKSLTDDFERGDVTFSQFIERLRGLGVAPDILEGLKNDLKDAVIEGDSAAIVLKKITDRIGELDSARATITISTEVIDPLGIFNPNVRQPMFDGGNLAKQYGAYGGARAAARDTQALADAQQQLREQSRQTGKEILTEIEIRRREQDLLENGFAKTREEARRLAVELAALEGLRIEIPIVIDVIDPLGVFKSRYTPIIDRDRLRDQYSKYGAGREAARIAAERAAAQRQRLDEAGDTGDRALNTPAKIAAREQELLEEGYADTRSEARRLAEEELNLAEKTRQANKAATESANEFKKFGNMIKELREEASGAFLSDLDRQVLEKAKTLKDGSAMMQQYIAAITSGDLSQAPAELLQVREALMQIGAASTWRSIIEKYGQGAQLAGAFAERQAQLNYLVATGKITAGQAAQDWADFIGQFKEYKWIDQTADALTNFVDEAVSDFDNIEDAFKNLLKNLARIALQEAVLNPLKEWFRGLFANMSGGGVTGGASSSLVNGTFGTGGASIFGIAKSLVGSAVQSIGESSKSAIMSGANAVALGGGSVAKQAWDFFKGKGLADHQVAGILGHIKAESAFNPTAIGDSGSAFGLFQHQAARGGGRGLIAGGAPAQLDLAWRELQTTEAGTLRRLLASKDVRSATTAFGGFERPQGWSAANPEAMHNFSGRLSGAEQALAKFGGTTTKVTETLTKSLGGFGEKLANFANSAAGGGSGGWFTQLASMFGGGGGALSFMNSISPLATKAILGGAVGLFHGGGTVGSSDGGTRIASFAAFSGARRFHNGTGVKSNEMAAILEKGEEVLKKRAAGKAVKTISGLAANAAYDRPSIDLTVQVIGGSGDDHVRKLANEGALAALSRYEEIQRRGGAAATDQKYSQLRAGRR